MSRELSMAHMSPGSAAGHFVPGMMLLVLGVHHAIGYTREFFGTGGSEGAKLSRTWYSVPWPLPACLARSPVPLEPLLKVVLVCPLLFYELYAKDLFGTR